MKKINFEQAAECLKTIAHPHRLAIIHCLQQHEKISVGEVAKHCDLQNHVTSEHLSLMKDRGFLQSQREGRIVYYSIKERALQSIMECIEKKFGS
jgi:DNA-binding transcriptional ArsR family regulator